MNVITFCEFEDGTKIGLFHCIVNKIAKATRIKLNNTSIRVYEQEYPTAEIGDKVFSKYVKAHKNGEYDKVFKKYNIDIQDLLQEVGKLQHK